MISFTEQAADKVLSIMKEQEVSNDTLVRVGVKGGGCSGFTYTVDFDNQKGKFDLEFESFGLNVLVDKKSHLFIKGTEIDWSDDLNDRGLSKQIIKKFKLGYSARIKDSLLSEFRKINIKFH